MSNEALSFPLSATNPDGSPATVTGAKVAILPKRRGPNAATVWTTAASFVAGVVTIRLAGPDADPTGATLIVPEAGGDLWALPLGITDYNPVRITRIYLLGGTGATAPAGTAYVTSLAGLTGVLTAQAAADALAGPLGVAYGPLTKVAATVTADGAAVVNKHNPVDASGAARTLTLPTGQAEGARIIVEKVDASVNTVTVTGNMRGSAGQSVSLVGQYEALSFLADAAGSWHPGPGHKTKAWLDTAYGRLPAFHGVRYTAYGHSFGQVQATPNAWAGSLYPARLRDLLRADASLYTNRTANGTTMTQIATTAGSTWVDGNGGLVTLMGNQNSVGNHVGITTFKAAVRSFLTTMLGATGYPPTVLVIKDTTSTSVGYARYGTPPTDAEVAQYNTWLGEVVAEFPAGWIVVADPMADGWDPATMTAPDGQHPNDRGMAHITASCLKALAAAPYRRGLNVGVTSTPIVVVPPQVTGLATGTTTASSVALSWSAATGATAYTVEYKATSSSTWLTATTGATGTSYTVTGLAASTSYDFRVSGSNSAGTGTASATVTASTGAAGDTTPPSTPTGLTVGTVTSSSVALSWTASTDNVAVTGYKVRRGGTIVGTPSGTSFTDTGLAASTAYSYTVSAVDAAANESAQTSPVTGTTSSGGTTYSADDFNRADGAFGSTPTGSFPWTVVNATAAIASSAATFTARASATNNDVWMDDGQFDGTISAKFTTVQQQGLLWRLGGGNTTGYITYITAGGVYAVAQRTAPNSYTTLFTSSQTAVAADVVSVVLSGDSQIVKVNGTTIYTGSTATLRGTRHGLWVSPAATMPAKFDDWLHTS